MPRRGDSTPSPSAWCRRSSRRSPAVKRPRPGVDSITIFQVLVYTLRSFRLAVVSDLARSCPGASQDPPCPTSYVSPHCANPVRAIDFVRVGGVVLRGDSVDALPQVHRLVRSRERLAGRVAVGGDLTFDYITEQFSGRLQSHSPAVSGALRVAVDPPRPSENIGEVRSELPTSTATGSTTCSGSRATSVLYHLRGDGQGLLADLGTVAGSGWDVSAPEWTP